MKYKYFVSGRWRNRNNVRELANKIREKGKTAYCFLDAGHSNHRLEKNPEESMKEFEAIKNWREDKYVKQIFENDMDGLRQSEVFVMLLPAGKSCHIEAGVAFGLGKRSILIGEQTKTESLYLIFDKVYSNVDEFIATI